MTTEQQQFSFPSSGFTATRGAFKPTKLHTVLVANRGEIALRLLRAARALQLKTVSVYTQADEGAPHRAQADVSVLLEGKESEGKGYLDQMAIVEAAKQQGAQVILPGYGFLSENAEFARLVEGSGLVFAGPRGDTIEELGLKHRARELAQSAGVPCVPGSGLLKSVDEAVKESERIGFPVMLKASAGGGGLGLQICRGANDVSKAYTQVVSRAKTLFGDADCFLEKYVERSHHVEIQIFGNGLGDVVHFGERECSIQRRHQKVFEEAPSPFVQAKSGIREKMTSCAVSFGQQAKYRSAGTLEFLVDDDTAAFYFLEVNTRLQVEHPVTEIVWDIDLVSLMLQQADYELQGKEGGIPSNVLQGLEPKGTPTKHAIEARVYCENALRDYQPSPGVLQTVEWHHDPKHHRIDGWVGSGTTVTPAYDPLLAKVIGFGSTRDQALNALASLFEQSTLYGPTNVDFLAAVLASKVFASGHTLTSFLQNDFQYEPAVLEVLEHGLSVSIQDLPGRPKIGHGLPISGPMDPISFRLANAIAGNENTNTEALEITLQGPTLRFHAEAVVALTGAEMELWLDDKPQSSYSKIHVPAGSTLRLGNLTGSKGGYRSYLAIRGGLPHVPLYLGSKSTCASLGLGGHQGRDLRAGDVLRLSPIKSDQTTFTLSQELHPALISDDTSKPTPIYCMRGPYDDDEYITAEGRNAIYQRPMTVSHNVARSGIRFVFDEQMQWARQGGGQGGSHPSNVLEFPYSFGGLNWNGDTPVALGNDGPDLGGLLISSTTVSAEYRLGQVSPGQKIQWTPITFQGAQELTKRQDAFVEQVLRAAAAGGNEGAQIKALSMQLTDQPDTSPVLSTSSMGDSTMTLRAAGDGCLLVELGEMRADIVVRAKVELLRRTIEQKSVQGILYVDVNIRTLSIRFDPRLLQQSELVKLVTDLSAQLPSTVEEMEKIPCRTWHLPLCFGHPDLGTSVDRYKATVRNKAVYLDDAKQGSDNRSYLARCNGLDEQILEKSLLECPLWTVGIGFFLGTPILLSQDRRTRLRCQKYNPTRLSTPEGAFGWGGSMGAIYGVECPGGYQLVARTLPLWSTFGTAPGFSKEQPWLLSSFDQIQFYRVSVEEYDRSLASLKAGTWKWQVDEKLFDAVEQAQFEASIAKEAEAYESQQIKAIEKCEAEEKDLYEAWRKEQQEQQEKQASGSGTTTSSWDWQNDPKAIKIKAAMNASVWKIAVQKEEKVKQDAAIVILEAMKTEIPCQADQDLILKEVLVQPGSLVSAGDVVAVGVAA